jgi:hypothetical protein
MFETLQMFQKAEFAETVPCSKGNYSIAMQHHHNRYAAASCSSSSKMESDGPFCTMNLVQTIINLETVILPRN